MPSYAPALEALRVDPTVTRPTDPYNRSTRDLSAPALLRPPVAPACIGAARSFAYNTPTVLYKVCFCAARLIGVLAGRTSWLRLTGLDRGSFPGPRQGDLRRLLSERQALRRVKKGPTPPSRSRRAPPRVINIFANPAPLSVAGPDGKIVLDGRRCSPATSSQLQDPPQHLHLRAPVQPPNRVPVPRGPRMSPRARSSATRAASRPTPSPPGSSTPARTARRAAPARSSAPSRPRPRPAVAPRGRQGAPLRQPTRTSSFKVGGRTNPRHGAARSRLTTFKSYFHSGLLRPQAHQV